MNGEFHPRPHNPAFEIVYVYSQQDGTLDLNYHGARQAVEPLQGVFARAILKLDELPSDPKDERVYDLSPLRERGFPFVFDPWSGIESVAAKKRRLSSTVRSGDRLTLEADPTRDREAVYALMDRALRKAPGHLYNVTQVELLAVVDVHEDKPAKKVTIRITHPNSCSLKYDVKGRQHSGHLVLLPDGESLKLTLAGHSVTLSETQESKRGSNWHKKTA